MRIKFFVSALFLFLFVSSSMAQMSKVDIKTSAVCEMCKEKIENELAQTSGISSAELNVKSKILSVEFKERKITHDEICEIISNLGYDADGVKADPEKYKALPNCCKKKPCSSRCGGHH